MLNVWGMADGVDTGETTDGSWEMGDGRWATAVGVSARILGVAVCRLPQTLQINPNGRRQQKQQQQQ